MADKPIKLTDAQLTTLQRVADPNYYSNPKLEHNSFYQYSTTVLYQLECDGLVHITDAQNDEIVNDAIVPCWVHLTDRGREFLGIAPIPLAPPPKTDKERIAELEAEVKRLDKMITAITVYSGNIQDSVHCYERMAKIRQVLLEAGKE